MKSFRLSSVLARSASVIAVSVCFVSSGAAFAQEAAPAEGDEIVVTGVRAALERAKADELGF